MWICDNCQESNEDNFDTCWKCLTLSEDNFKRIQSNNQEKNTIDDEEEISSFNDLVIFFKERIISFLVFCKTYYKIMIILLCIPLINDTDIGNIISYLVLSFYCILLFLVIIMKLIEGHLESITTSIRNSILTFIATNLFTRLPERELKLFLNFLKTGKISSSQSKPIYTNMVLGFRGIAIPGPIIIFFMTNINWIWLPVLWLTGADLLEKPGRYLLTKAGMKDTGEKFGIYKDLETAKAYFKKKSIFK
jgi:hypothetical protein